MEFTYKELNINSVISSSATVSNNPTDWKDKESHRREELSYKGIMATLIAQISDDPRDKENASAPREDEIRVYNYSDYKLFYSFLSIFFPEDYFFDIKRDAYSIPYMINNKKYDLLITAPIDSLLITYQVKLICYAYSSDSLYELNSNLESSIQFSEDESVRVLVLRKESGCPLEESLEIELEKLAHSKKIPLFECDYETNEGILELFSFVALFGAKVDQAKKTGGKFTTDDAYLLYKQYQKYNFQTLVNALEYNHFMTTINITGPVNSKNQARIDAVINRNRKQPDLISEKKEQKSLIVLSSSSKASLTTALVDNESSGEEKNDVTKEKKINVDDSPVAELIGCNSYLMYIDEKNSDQGNELDLTERSNVLTAYRDRLYLKRSQSQNTQTEKEIKRVDRPDFSA